MVGGSGISLYSNTPPHANTFRLKA